MTTITVERELLEQALVALSAPNHCVFSEPPICVDIRAALAAPATAPDSQEVKQIAEALRRIGMTLIRTGTGFKVMALGTITAQEDKP